MVDPNIVKSISLVLLLLAHTFPLQLHPEIFVHSSSPVCLSNLRHSIYICDLLLLKAIHLPLLVDAIGSIQEGTSRPSIKHKVYKWWKEYDDSVLWLFTSGRIFSSTPPLKTFSKSCGTSVTYEDYKEDIYFALRGRSDTWPSLSMCSSQSSWQRGGVLATWFSFFRFNSYLKNLISFTGCTVDITHSRVLLTTCKSQRLQQSSIMQLVSGLSVCHANDQKRTKSIEAK